MDFFTVPRFAPPPAPYTVRQGSSTVPCAGFGRVQANTRPLEGVRLAGAIGQPLPRACFRPQHQPPPAGNGVPYRARGRCRGACTWRPRLPGPAAHRPVDGLMSFAFPRKRRNDELGAVPERPRRAFRLVSEAHVPRDPRPSLATDSSDSVLKLEGSAGNHAGGGACGPVVADA